MALLVVSKVVCLAFISTDGSVCEATRPMKTATASEMNLLFI